LPTNSVPDGFANDSSLRAGGTTGSERDSAVSASTLGININYPHLSRVLREEGVALVELDISGSSVRLLKSSGHQRLDTAALAALKNFKPTASQARIVEFEFKIR
jgi:TonB family protein